MDIVKCCHKFDQTMARKNTHQRTHGRRGVRDIEPRKNYKTSERSEEKSTRKNNLNNRT